MSTYTPKDPETITTFDAALAEYNTVFETEYQFFFDNHPSDVAFTVHEESTTDGYSVWVMRAADDGIYLTKNVYYHAPSGNDLFRELEYMLDDCKVYCELEQYEIEETLLDRLCTNYHNYLTSLEDEKVK